MTALFHGAVTRRKFLGTGAFALAASALPSAAPAQGALFRRFEISDPGMPQRVLDSYKKGIREMLNRPPTDPRNWYRNAFIHVFDCPHQNWWFLAWHRAYIGWLEATIREFSGDAQFTLPYWDWTKTPRVPAALLGLDKPAARPRRHVRRRARSQQRRLHPDLRCVQGAVRRAGHRAFCGVLAGATGRAGAAGLEQHGGFLECGRRCSGGHVL